MKNAFSFFTPRQDDSQQILARKAAQFLSSGLGLGGVDHIHDTAAHSGVWWCIHALGGDVVISKVVYASGYSNEDLTGATLSNGDRIYGPILSITLTSGRIEAYRATNG